MCVCTLAALDVYYRLLLTDCFYGSECSIWQAKGTTQAYSWIHPCETIDSAVNEQRKSKKRKPNETGHGNAYYSVSQPSTILWPSINTWYAPLPVEESSQHNPSHKPPVIVNRANHFIVGVLAWYVCRSADLGLLVVRVACERSLTACPQSWVTEFSYRHTFGASNMCAYNALTSQTSPSFPRPSLGRGSKRCACNEGISFFWLRSFLTRISVLVFLNIIGAPSYYKNVRI